MEGKTANQYKNGESKRERKKKIDFYPSLVQQLTCFQILYKTENKKSIRNRSYVERNYKGHG